MPEIVASLVGVEVVPSLLPEALRARSIQAIIELFRAAGSTGPLLLLVEDIHEVDPSTLEVLNRLSTDEELGGYLMLMTSRHSIEGLVSEPEVLEVAPLGSDETRQLVASLLPDAARRGGDRSRGSVRRHPLVRRGAVSARPLGDRSSPGNARGCADDTSRRAGIRLRAGGREHGRRRT